MATAQPTQTKNVGADNNKAILITWPLLTANPDGAALDVTECATLDWQATGTIGGATVAFEGSNDGTNWFALFRAGTGAAFTLTAVGGGRTVDAPRYVRPNLTTPGAGAIIAVTLLARK
jgi:hypothetical protein